MADALPAETVAAPRGGRSAQRSFCGEELPVFCEACGYHLHGLPPVKCQHCEVMHLRCPECGHTQPVNSLRPAMQQWLGRLRAQGLMLLVAGKCLLAAILLFIWYPIGYSELARHYSSLKVWDRVLRAEEEMGVLIYAVACGLIFRFLALRFRNGSVVGLVAGFVACLIMMLGYAGRVGYLRQYGARNDMVFSSGLLLMVAGAHLLAGAVCWPAWVLAVKVLLPQRAGERLLAWQRANRSNETTRDVTAAEAEFGRQ